MAQILITEASSYSHAIHIFDRSKGSLRRISSLGALGEGSGWNLRIRPAAQAAPGPKPGPKWVGPLGAQVGGPHVGPTHEKNGGKFLKIFFTHEKMEANS